MISPTQAVNIAPPAKPYNPPATPQNTPAAGVPAGVGLSHRHTAQGLSRPINAASAMRGRALIPGALRQGAPTPANTPNSLEKISRRIATGLAGGQSPSPQGKIAPSYE